MDHWIQFVFHFFAFIYHGGFETPGTRMLRYQKTTVSAEEEAYCRICSARSELGGYLRPAAWYPNCRQRSRNAGARRTAPPGFQEAWSRRASSPAPACCAA